MSVRFSVLGGGADGGVGGVDCELAAQRESEMMPKIAINAAKR